jgi:hypothetical protein
MAAEWRRNTIIADHMPRKALSGLVQPRGKDAGAFVQVSRLSRNFLMILMDLSREYFIARQFLYSDLDSPREYHHPNEVKFP